MPLRKIHTDFIARIVKEMTTQQTKQLTELREFGPEFKQMADRMQKEMTEARRKMGVGLLEFTPEQLEVVALVFATGLHVFTKYGSNSPAMPEVKKLLPGIF